MKRDPINELYQIGRMLGDDRVKNALYHWVNEYVKTVVVRHYSQENDTPYLQHIEEKGALMLAEKLVREYSLETKYETLTANIYEKSIMVLGEP
jgi:hypothetical protein